MDDYYDDGNPYASPKPVEESAPVRLVAVRRWRRLLLAMIILRGVMSGYLAMGLLVADYTPELWARVEMRLPYQFGFYWVIAVLLPLGIAHRLYRALGHAPADSGFLIIARIGAAGAFAWTGLILVSIVFGFSFRSTYEGWVFLFALMDISFMTGGLYGFYDFARTAEWEESKDVGE